MLPIPLVYTRGILLFNYVFSWTVQLLTSAMLFPCRFMIRNKVGRTKFIHGKRHRVKQTARIVLSGCYALLVGHTVLGGIDKILSGTNDPDDGKYSKAYK